MDCDSFRGGKKKNKTVVESTLVSSLNVYKLLRPFAAKQLELQMQVLMSSPSLLTLLLYSVRGMGM